MAGLNGTGPWGQGPMSGRGMGYCNPNASSVRGTAFYGCGFGRGLGPGFGRGAGRGIGRNMVRGMGRGFGRYPFGDPAVYPEDYRAMDYPPNRAQDKNYLEQRQSLLETELRKVKETLTSLVEEEQE